MWLGLLTAKLTGIGASVSESGELLLLPRHNKLFFKKEINSSRFSPKTMGPLFPCMVCSFWVVQDIGGPKESRAPMSIFFTGTPPQSRNATAPFYLHSTFPAKPHTLAAPSKPPQHPQCLSSTIHPHLRCTPQP